MSNLYVSLIWGVHDENGKYVLAHGSRYIFHPLATGMHAE